MQLFQFQGHPLPVELDFAECVLRYAPELQHLAGLPGLDRQSIRRQPCHAQLHLQIVHLLLMFGPGLGPAIGEQVDFTLPLLQIPPQATDVEVKNHLPRGNRVARLPQDLAHPGIDG